MVEVVRVKEEIERKIETNVNEDELELMQQQFTDSLKEYEKLVTDKIQIFSDMISQLKNV